MTSMFARLRRRLTFANITASVALFVALGGTGYAATRLPANSVGITQIRSNAVGKSEIRTNAVGASEIRRDAVGSSETRANAVGASELREGSIDTTELTDGGITVADLSAASRAALTPERAVVTAAGTPTLGTAANVTHSGPGIYNVTFRRDVSGCTYAATPASVTAAGTATDPQPGATAAVASGGAAVVVVRTFAPGAGGAPAATDTPFDLIVACAA